MSHHRPRELGTRRRALLGGLISCAACAAVAGAGGGVLEGSFEAAATGDGSLTAMSAGAPATGPLIQHRIASAHYVMTEANGDEYFEAIAACESGEVGLEGRAEDLALGTDPSRPMVRVVDAGLFVDPRVVPARYLYRAAFQMRGGWRSERSPDAVPIARIVCRRR